MPSEAVESARPAFNKLLRHVLTFLAVLVVARFILELVGLPHDTTRYISATVGMLFAGIYVAAVGPLRGGAQKFKQLLWPALLIPAWTVAWVILATIIAAVLRLQRSHFAEPTDYGNWRALGVHLLGHLAEIVIFFLLLLLLMAALHLLWRWPVTVAPGVFLGVFVIMRFWVEAMGVEPWRAAAWSSTVLILLAGFYLGGMGARLGPTEARKLLAPSLALGWAWRFWVYLATLFAALIPIFKTHFFDRSQGDIAGRLLRLLAVNVLEGFIVGLIIWGIAVWIARATRPQTAA